MLFTEVQAKFLFIHTLGLRDPAGSKKEQHPVIDFEVNFILIIYVVGLDQRQC